MIDRIAQEEGTAISFSADRKSRAGAVIVGLIAAAGLGAWFLVSRQQEPAAPPPPKIPSPAALAEEAKFQHAVLMAIALKQSMRDPSSFQLTDATYMPGGTLCFEFTAANGFNARTSGYAVVPETGKSFIKGNAGAPEAWNKHCAGKTGHDMSHIRQALK